MKTISIKELHAETGRWVRSAKSAPVTVTDHGEPVAMLAPYDSGAKKRPVFLGRDLASMPKVPVDSTIYISEDRDGR